MSLHDALGGMRGIAQWFLWRLTWNAAEGKYDKIPACGDASKPANWMSYEQARAALQPGHALGFWLSADSGYWFFDLDKRTAFGDKLAAAFPGALVELSSSGKGLHVIGKLATPVGAHRTRPPRDVAAAVAPMQLEFYTQGRGIAFGLTGEATGSADAVFDVRPLLDTYFAGAVVDAAELPSGPRAEWRGPTDDDDALIAKMLASSGKSAAAVFGNGDGKVSLARLWAGDCELSSENDMALACHLAFWTGCDALRMERLMRRSGLVRAKWNEHRTYLRELTIGNACALCTQVYQEPERSVAGAAAVYGPPMLVTHSAGPLIAPEMSATVRDLLDEVSACGTLEDMHNLVVPRIIAAGVPMVYQEQLVRSVNSKLDLWDAKLPVGKLRALLFPPVVHDGGNDAPEWMQKHCYVKDGDFFYDMQLGTELTYQGFIAEYSRLMPARPTGGRENPVEWAFTRWGIRTVHHLAYRPDQPAYFEWDGLDYANRYSPASVPATAVAYSEEGIAGIQALHSMMYDMCGRRDDVFAALLFWFAHNVQRPGVKIRWSPLIKGVPGDAKTILGNVLRSVMGYRNVSVTGNNVLRNTGGFTDWATRAAVNYIEEIHLVGKDRHLLYNAMKEFITNEFVSINRKGKTAIDMWNCTNHIANTNENDAIPLAKDDRRWLVIFTPWESLAEMYSYCGYTKEQWQARTAALDFAWKYRAGELRAWFFGLPLQGDANGAAMMTPEKMQMMASSQEDAESVATHLIGELKVISSAWLTSNLRLRAALDGFEIPKTTNLNHMLTRMGFSKFPKQVKFRGGTHTIWVKNGFNGDIRLEADKLPTQLPTGLNL